VSLDIPAVGLSAPIVPVGLDGQGEIDVPAPSVAGWYRLGPAPGATGPAVIVGHVDTYTGPAVFYRLTAVRTGEEVDVVRADGSRARFVITAVTQVNKSAFPSQAVFGPTGGSTIRLITCDGPFNPRSHHYVDSLIAWGVAVPGAPRR
jgi:sortase (surface protein transpeptidase)